MRKFSFLWLLIALFSMVSCEKKPTESSTSAQDSLKTDSAAAPIESAPEVELSAEGKIIARKWKAIEFETPSVKLSGELVDIRFDFRKDGTFDYSEEGKTESGKWSTSEDNKVLHLEYTTSIKADMNIKEVKEDKLIIAGKEHGMFRTYTLAPQ